MRRDTLPHSSYFGRKAVLVIHSSLPQYHSPSCSTLLVLLDADLGDRISKVQAKLVHQQEQLLGWHGLKLSS